MTADPSPKLDIDWLKTIAGALAAVSSAVLLSTLGAAGTIIGAALGSVIVTVGGALYSQGLARSRERLLQAQTAALRKVGVAQAEVRRAGRPLALTATEFRLLAELARRPGRVFSRDLLLENVWGYGYLGDSRLVDVAVQRLRAKVEADPAHPSLIVTVRGVGYRLQEPS